ncbi:MAG: hypothetical protein ACI4RA_04335, partial [Kiritimatiellia bacterium]
MIELRKRFSEAEEAIKRYERIGLDNLVSAVNELRYAGDHLLVADTTEDADVRETALLRAERHCIRARYDAIESTIITLLEQIAAVRQSGLSSEELSTVLPDWKECLLKAVAAQKAIESAGAVRDVDPDILEGALSDLLAYRYRLLALEPQVVQLRNEALDRQEAEKRLYEQLVAEEQERRERVEKVLQARQFLLSFSATVAGTIVGLLGVLLAVFGMFPRQWYWGILLGLLVFAALCLVSYWWARNRLLSKESFALL